MQPAHIPQESKIIAFNLIDSILNDITKDHEKLEKKKKFSDFFFKNLIDLNKQKIIRDIKFTQG